MKNIVLCAFMSLIFSGTAMADFSTCTTTYVYTVCNTGYYLANNACNRCPDQDGATGTTVASNSGGKTSCYMPTSASMTDNTGTYSFTANCYYTN